MPGRELGKAIVPAGAGAVGRRGIDDAGGRICHQRHRLPSGCVRQAKKDQVRRVHQLLPLHRVLPLVFVNEQQGNIVPGADPVVDLQAGGALFSVNIYDRLHVLSSIKAAMASIWRVVS